MDRVKRYARELGEIKDREATKLFRLSRRAAAHGCSELLCVRIRMEAWELRRMDPWYLMDPFRKWEFAFK